jgi:hypothetical protein
MSKWDETDPYTDYELGSSRPHGLLPKPEPEPNWRSMYEAMKVSRDKWFLQASQLSERVAELEERIEDIHLDYKERDTYNYG